MQSLEFDTTTYSGIGVLREVNTSYKPTLHQSNNDKKLTLRGIHSLTGPYMKGKELGIRKSKTSTAVLQLVWFVETFF